jgi:hypothetical protein
MQSSPVASSAQSFLMSISRLVFTKAINLLEQKYERKALSDEKAAIS